MVYSIRSIMMVKQSFFHLAGYFCVLLAALDMAQASLIKTSVYQWLDVCRAFSGYIDHRPWVIKRGVFYYLPKMSESTSALIRQNQQTAYQLLIRDIDRYTSQLESIHRPDLIAPLSTPHSIIQQNITTLHSPHLDRV